MTQREASTCPNCGTALPDGSRYCPGCGQDQRAKVVPLKGLVLELLQDWFAADPKFFRTIPLLFFRPGRLTQEFVAGRRARYVPPARLYVFVSVLSFFLFSLGSGVMRIGPQENEAVVMDTVRTKDATISFAGTPVSLATIRAEIDSVGEDAWLKEHVLQGPWSERVMSKAGYLLAKGRAREVVDRMRRQLPLTLLLLIPLLAFLVKLFHWRQYYVVHLVFGFHLGSFFLLATALLHVLDMMVGTALAGLILLLFPVHLAMAIRRLYGGGFTRSVAVTITLLILFLLFLLLALVLSMAFAVVAV